MFVCIRVTDEITPFKKSSTNAFLVFLQVSDCTWIHVDDSKLCGLLFRMQSPVC